MRPGQSREILSETVAWDKAVKIVLLEAEASEVVPAAHVLTRRGQAGNLSENFEEAIVFEIQEPGMVLVELPFHGTVQQFHFGIRESRERRFNADSTTVRDGPSGNHTSRVGGSCGSGRGLQKSSAADAGLHKFFLSDRKMV
jgi:hypothetical protein